MALLAAGDCRRYCFLKLAAVRIVRFVASEESAGLAAASRGSVAPVEKTASAQQAYPLLAVASRQALVFVRPEHLDEVVLVDWMDALRPR